MKILEREDFTIPESIFWWEKQRIIYNVLMAIIGFLSFFIGYVSIPLVYLIIAINLNILFTLSWIIEIIFIKLLKSQEATQDYTHIFIFVFYGYSIVAVLLYIYYPGLLDWTFIIWGLK